MPTFHNYTGRLRFVKRPASVGISEYVKILQQERRIPHITLDTHGHDQIEYEYVWEDVPLVETPEKGP